MSRAQRVGLAIGLILLFCGLGDVVICTYSEHAAGNCGAGGIASAAFVGILAMAVPPGQAKAWASFGGVFIGYAGLLAAALLAILAVPDRQQRPVLV
jgi:hypothetical protein